MLARDNGDESGKRRGATAVTALLGSKTSAAPKPWDAESLPNMTHDEAYEQSFSSVLNEVWRKSPKGSFMLPEEVAHMRKVALRL